MKKNVHPAVAALIIIAVICAAGYWIWASNQDAPIPDRFISPSEGAKMAMGMSGGKGPAPAAKPGEKGPGAAKMDTKAPAAKQDAKSAAPKEGEKPAAKESEKPAAKEDASAK
ncbi:MAG TPA: hypothetical protein VFB21_06865 [Chthonomonadaceae bacterium]|nr:hypothetical protein [Chthonomonadaceae bacterium]